MIGTPLNDNQLMEDLRSPEAQVEQYIQDIEAVCQHRGYWMEIAESKLPDDELPLLKQRIAVVIQDLSEVIQRLEQLDAERT
jgi:hypothetical protein